MKVAVLVKATSSSEQGILPSEQLLKDMGEFNEDLVAAGIMKAGEGLKPSSAGYRVHFKGGERIVTSGPFTETNELVAGFWIWEVKSLEEAIEWVKRCPNPMLEESDIEIRPIYSIEDFAEVDPNQEIKKQEEALSSRLAGQNSTITPYLFFSGRCEEAIDFYASNLGAEVLMKMRFNEGPEPTPEGKLQAGFENKIMHATLRIGRSIVMLSDGCDDASGFDGFRLSLELENAESARAAFQALSAEGSVEMPLTETFWSPCFGMLTDRFGVAWMITIPGAK